MNVFDPINLLRVIATLMVFFLHACIFNGKDFVSGQMFFDYPLAFIFKTPAWAGCWIFFMISGYLAGLGYQNKRYELTIQGSIKYYKKKIKSVWFPTVGFIFLLAVMVFPEFFVQNPKQILSLFICTYNGNPGVDGIGATWFVFTLMWLYLFTPLFIYLLNRINVRKYALQYCGMIILLGLIYRLGLHYFQFDWYLYVYTSFFANIDLYVCGICIAYASIQNRRFFMKERVAAISILCCLILFNSYIYSQNKWFGVYQFLLPSVYIVVVSFYLLVFCQKDQYKKWNSNIWKYVNEFSGISFEFYLFHSLILSRISKLVGGDTSLTQYLKLIVITGIITLVLSRGYHIIFQRKTYKINQ